MLRDPAYRRALLFCALIGIPVSALAFWFLAALHELEQLVWTDWPKDLGWPHAPWWWPFPAFALAGLVVPLVAGRLPGRGGHVPAVGLHAGGTTTAALPGVIIAALFSLPLGAVLGPEAPLIALGGGLALVFRDLARAPASPQSTALLGAAGSAAAISAIFGNPLVAGVLLMEVAGVGGPRLFAVMLPALLASGIGSVIFSGFGQWTGFATGSLAVGLPAPPPLDTGDVVWSLLMGLVIGAAVHALVVGGRYVAVFVSGRLLPHTTLCALAAGGCVALFAVSTGRSPSEAALSGQATLSQLAKDPHAWSVGALVAVLAFKGAAYLLCLGSLRGGPVFPALFLGGAAGALLAPLPGLGLVPAMAAGMAAAATSALRLPVSSVVLVAIMLGHSGSAPVIVLASVVSFMAAELLPQGPVLPEPSA
ncbi:chloride channel protein [Streptomyces sp. CBMA29]|uniref:chloride channel protein n=1 Tax=Streptomyces sp. CBMA29 TaxID=1896314 RepID=UPI001661EBC9|nr:chloride channel protein [Streptomyces sp. CBMA29]MBD0734917.1 chloride channel core [Streptomyces sp. CBMA29]